MAQAIQIEKQGRRYYITGNTYPIKDKIRAAGCKFDGDRKAWWTGKKDVAEEIVSRLSDEVAQLAKERSESRDRKDAQGLDTEVQGRASYHSPRSGKTSSMYVIWEGTTRKGDRRAKLCSRDGSFTFWAKEGTYTITKTYQARKSLREIKAYAEYVRGRDSGEVECRTCERWCTCGSSFCPHHHDGCEECGAEG